MSLSGNFITCPGSISVLGIIKSEISALSLSWAKKVLKK
jgi:hypothetical protein